MIRVETPAGDKMYTVSHFGLNDKRSPSKRTMVWDLLKLFCEHHGEIKPEGIKYDRCLPDTAKRLNTFLKDKFGIKDSIYTDPYKKAHGYFSKKFFSNDTEITP